MQQQPAVVIDDESIAALVDKLASLYPEPEILAACGVSEFAGYAGDPVGFVSDVLGESLTPDLTRLMESVRDNVVTVAKSANATGKTFTAARIAAWFYKVHVDSQVYTAAAPPESNLKKLLWGELGSIFERNPKLFEGDVKTSLHISRSAQSFITGVTIPSSGTDAQREAKFSGKHAPYIMFILDEGDAIPDEVYRGIESCMSGGHARLLVMFNPRSESGEVYRMERDSRAAIVELSAFNHPNVLEDREVIPGAVNRETVVRRINLWCRPVVDGEDLDSSETFELPEFLEGAPGVDLSGRAFDPLAGGVYRITQPEFAYMVLGRYPAQAVNQLISRAWVTAAVDRWRDHVRKFGEVAPAGVRPVCGLDAAEMGADANVLISRYGGYVGRPVSWGGVDMMETGDRGARAARAVNPKAVYVDATGVGAGVAPHMRRLGVAAFSVKVASKPTHKTELGEFGNIRDQLWWACREWLRTDPNAMLPNDEGLLEELAAPTYEIRGGKIKIMPKISMKELLRRSPDRADALCLTFSPQQGYGASVSSLYNYESEPVEYQWD